jgi:hypothetical protein
MYVQGIVRWIDGNNNFATSTVYIKVERVLGADAPSEIIGEKIINGVGSETLKRGLKFSINVDVDAGRDRDHYLRVHVDTTGDGKVTVGDLINTTSYPIPQYLNDVNVEISLKQL